MSRARTARRLLDVAVVVRDAQERATDKRERRRLRRAELRLRQELEDAVPKGVVAQVLGVSTTALERWVDAGAIPVVRRPAGREEVAADAAIDLVVEVERLRAEGLDQRVVGLAIERLRERGRLRRRLRPNESARELMTAYRATTPVRRLEDTAELSLVGTTLAAYGRRAR